MKFNKFLILTLSFALNFQFIFGESTEDKPIFNLNQEEQAKTDFEARCHGHRKCHKHHSHKHHSHKHSSHNCGDCIRLCQLGSSTFFVLDPSLWYTVETFPFPISSPLTLNRNAGTAQGNVQLTPTGLVLGEAGNYQVHYSVTIANQTTLPVSLITFLVENEVFDPLMTNTMIASVGVIPADIPSTMHGTGILHNVPAGTRLSVIGMNTGGETQMVTVVNWRIDAFKIPCDTPPVVL